MSAAYLVIYEGEPDDREAFLRFYIDHHLPLIWAWPKILGVELELGAGGGDPHAREAGIFMVARFLFANPEDLRAALSSEARRQAYADRANFPPFHGMIRHQAVEILEIAHGGR